MPLLNKCIGLITDEGGITSHASIVSRELQIPSIIGTKVATKVFSDGDLIEIDTSKNIAIKIALN
jgi:pyruvate,water dikinase